jgi:hypothetical protein
VLVGGGLPGHPAAARCAPRGCRPVAPGHPRGAPDSRALGPHGVGGRCQAGWRRRMGTRAGCRRARRGACRDAGPRAALHWRRPGHPTTRFPVGMDPPLSRAHSTRTARPLSPPWKSSTLSTLPSCCPATASRSQARPATQPTRHAGSACLIISPGDRPWPRLITRSVQAVMAPWNCQLAAAQARWIVTWSSTLS